MFKSYIVIHKGEKYRVTYSCDLFFLAKHVVTGEGIKVFHK